MATINIGGRRVGDDQPVFVIAEIGINHNGDLKVAKELIRMAHETGCDAVKFQKRTIEICYTPEELAAPRESPWGTTNGEQKRGLELSHEAYREIDRYCHELGIMWTASPWDNPSVDFLEEFDLPFYKIPSTRARGHDDFLRYVRSKGRPIIMSTGACNEEQIRHAVEVVGHEDLVLLHCILQYPCESGQLNLLMVRTLREWFPNVPIGYSGHEKGPGPSVMAAAIGASVIERHITLDRTMYGSDQAASLEKHGLELLIRDLRVWDRARGTGVREVLEAEDKNFEKMRLKTR